MSAGIEIFEKLRSFWFSWVFGRKSDFTEEGLGRNGVLGGVEIDIGWWVED